MPPKKEAAPKKKLHELAPEVPVGFKVTDTKRRSFEIGKFFAAGGFGRIHFCNEEAKSKQLVIKIEPQANGPLFTEMNVFQRILKEEQIEAYKKAKKISWIGLPFVISCGIFNYKSDKMRYLIMPKYATSLENVREKNNGVFTLKQTMEVALSTLNSLKYVHDMEYTHADIKAGNILLEKETDFKTAVLVDFGLARMSSKNEDKPDKKRAHNGTCIFTSIDAHRGCHPSFRGDIEILAYNMIYWLTGTLPWIEHEQAPEKAYEAKKKFVEGMPATLKSVLKDHPNAVDTVSIMFSTVKTTNYAAKVDFSKLVSIVSKTSLLAPNTSKTPSKKAKEEVVEEAPKSTRRAKKRVSESPKIEQEPPKKTASGRVSKQPVKTDVGTTSTRKVTRRSETPSTPVEVKTPRRRVIEESPPSSTEKKAKKTLKENAIPSIKKASTAVMAAKKIEKKYKRLSGMKTPEPTGRTSRSMSRSAEKVEDDVATPVKSPPSKKPTRKYGLTSATKADETELRRVPGVRNFPKGRRSMLIRDTVARYSSKRGGPSTSTPTFNDDDA